MLARAWNLAHRCALRHTGMLPYSVILALLLCLGHHIGMSSSAHAGAMPSEFGHGELTAPPATDFHTEAMLLPSCALSRATVSRGLGTGVDPLEHIAVVPAHLPLEGAQKLAAPDPSSVSPRNASRLALLQRFLN
jgi:hypothetical protein